MSASFFNKGHSDIGRNQEFLMTSTFVARCRNCRRIILSDVPRIGARESDALVSHLKNCRPDLVARADQRWRTEMGPLLEHFDVQQKA